MLAGGLGIEATLLLDWTDGEPTVPLPTPRPASRSSCRWLYDADLNR